MFPRLTLRLILSCAAAAAMLGACAGNKAPIEDRPGHDNMFIVLGEGGTPVARLITRAAVCPRIRIDGADFTMNLRARADTLPLRPTRSAPEDSKPSAFPVLTCEKVIPPDSKNVMIEGNMLPLLPATVNRIVVIGDTGCRIKKSDNASQPCNDAAQYPFATVAAHAAAWKPDLVVHVGDYLYRETICPEGNAGCAGSPWGYGWDAWRADFFRPGEPLLHAAPWVMVRGNHESCARAGQGWWRLMDPRPLLPGRDCITAANDDSGDYSDPYAVPIGNGAQVIVFDSSNTTGGAIKPGDLRAVKYADMYRKVDLLSQQASYNISADHHPILGFTAKEGGKLMPGNGGLQSIWGQQGSGLIPPRIDMMLSGHVHVWEQVSFAGRESTQLPSQFIAGFSGTMEDTVPLPAQIPQGESPAPGAIVEHFSSWVDGFGYMTMERQGKDHWDVKIWNVAGQQVNACHVDGRKSVCDKAQVPPFKS